MPGDVTELGDLGVVVEGTNAGIVGRALSPGTAHGRGIVGRNVAENGAGPGPLNKLPPMPKLTGERPTEGQTPDSLLAFHTAGYREIRARLGPGTVLDVGCGLGADTAELATPGRTVLGIDYDPPTAVEAGRTRAGDGTHGQDLRFAAMDGIALGIRDHTIDYVLSSHVIEHFFMPEQHVAELARVCSPGGRVFVVTPNRPADFENPFHVYLFEAPELASLLRLFFEDVEVLGLDGSAELQADFARRRASGERLLKLDPLRLRQHMPRSWYVWSYEHVLPVVYRALGSSTTGVGSGIDDSHFFLTDTIEPTTPGLFAISRAPAHLTATRFTAPTVSLSESRCAVNQRAAADEVVKRPDRRSNSEPEPPPSRSAPTQSSHSRRRRHPTSTMRGATARWSGR